MYPFFKGNGTALEKACLSWHFKATRLGFIRMSQFARFLVSLIEFRILIWRCAQPSVFGAKTWRLHNTSSGSLLQQNWGEPTSIGGGEGERLDKPQFEGYSMYVLFTSPHIHLFSYKKSQKLHDLICLMKTFDI